MLLKNRNHTGISRISDADKEGFIITSGGHFHKKELVDLFASARLEVFPAYLNLKVLDAPFKSLLMSCKEHVKAVSFNGTASVENSYRLAVAIAGNEHFGTERISSVCRHKGIARLYFVSASRYAV